MDVDKFLHAVYNRDADKVVFTMDMPALFVKQVRLVLRRTLCLDSVFRTTTQDNQEVLLHDGTVEVMMDYGVRLSISPFEAALLHQLLDLQKTDEEKALLAMHTRERIDIVLDRINTVFTHNTRQTYLELTEGRYLKNGGHVMTSDQVMKELQGLPGSLFAMYQGYRCLVTDVFQGLDDKPWLECLLPLNGVQTPMQDNYFVVSFPKDVRVILLESCKIERQDKDMVVMTSSDGNTLYAGHVNDLVLPQDIYKNAHITWQIQACVFHAVFIYQAHEESMVWTVTKLRVTPSPRLPVQNGGNTLEEVIQFWSSHPHIRNHAKLALSRLEQLGLISRYVTTGHDTWKVRVRHLITTETRYRIAKAITRPLPKCRCCGGVWRSRWYVGKTTQGSFTIQAVYAVRLACCSSLIHEHCLRKPCRTCGHILPTVSFTEEPEFVLTDLY